MSALAPRDFNLAELTVSVLVGVGKRLSSKIILLYNMSEVALTRLSSKGQIVVPKGLRNLMGLEDGEIFAIYGEDDTIVLKRLELPSEKEFQRLLDWGENFAKKKGLTKTEVQKAIKEYRKGE